MSEQKEFEARAPREGEFFRTHPDPSYRKEVTMVDVDGVLRIVDDHMMIDADDVKRVAPGLYIVDDDMIDEVKRVAPEKRLRKFMIFTVVNMEGETFLWPVPSPVAADHPAFQAIENWVSIGMPKELDIDPSQFPNLILSDPDTKH